MSDDVTADCVGGENEHFSHMVVPFTEREIIWNGFNTAGAFYDFSLEWEKSLDPDYLRLPVSSLFR